MEGRVHSIESFGSLDGPGIRFIVFLSGCILRCRYCHNPDTWDATRGEMRSADDVLKQALRYRTYWGKNGGITVSGGEPLLQIDFLIELFTKAKKLGISTCIDTAGQPFTRKDPYFSKFEKLMEVTDLLLVDIKHIDNQKHIDLTGKPNDNILDMFRYLDSIHKPIWIRHVLVPGITENDEDLFRTRAFIRTLSNVQKIDVLPFHKMGTFKWKNLGIPFTLENTNPPSKESVAHAEDILNGKFDAKLDSNQRF